MTLRAKILWAQLPVGLGLAVLGVLSVLTASELGTSAEGILKQNYRSVLAAQRMKESIERIDSAALFIVAGQRDKGLSQAAEYQPRFEAELQVEEENFTEEGEPEAARDLRAAWSEYQRRFEALTRAPPDQAAVTYFGELAPVFEQIKSAADRVLEINQDAMVRKSDTAQRTASIYQQLLAAGAAAALVLGIALSVWLTSRLLRPLDSLSQAARRLGQGDLEARALVLGSDEIAQLARDFNEMADHLAQYRRSSLGELLRAQQASQAAIDSLPDPVVVFDLDGAVLNVNQAAETLLGLKVEASEDPVASLAPEVREVLATVRDHVLTGHGPFVPRGFEEAIRVGSQDGDRWLMPRAAPLYGESRSVVGVTVVLQDVTRLRRFDELKNDLVATVAHEFKTPLTSLRLAIHLCAEGAAGPVTERQTDLLFAARQDCERLQGIVDDLLDVARLQSGRLTLQRIRVAPDALLAAAADAYDAEARQQRVTLEVRALPSLEDVLVDPERIHLVLSNLVSNAIRHTPPGGIVRLNARPQDGDVRFEIADTGEGIPPEFHDRIFDRFFQVPGRVHGRVGLGLSIAKEIVEAHGGTIGVESEPHRGATFWFTVPVVAHE